MHTHLTHLPTHKTMEAQMHAARVVRKALRTMGSEVMPATFEASRANVLTTLAEHHAALGPMYKPMGRPPTHPVEPRVNLWKLHDMLCHHFCAHLATFTPGNRKTPEHVMQLRAALRPQGALEESVEKGRRYDSGQTRSGLPAAGLAASARAH